MNFKKSKSSNFIKLISGIVLISNLLSCSSKKIENNIESINTFAHACETLQKVTSNTLVIFDLDETAIFQRSETLPAVLVELCLPEYIKKLQQKGAKVIALTNSMTFLNHESNTQEEWRHASLINHNIDLSKSVNDFIIFDDLPPFENNYPILSKGVLYTNRVPKGQVLKAFLQKLKMTPDKVIFFDDQHHNLVDVGETLKEMKIPYWGYEYNKVNILLYMGFDYPSIYSLLERNIVTKCCIL